MLSLAIPGQPTEWRRPDSAVITYALADIQHLSAEVANETLLGFMADPVTARWCEALNTLWTIIDDRYTRRPATRFASSSHRHVIEWRWGVISRTDVWYDLGWHPSEQFDALASDWRQRLRQALNRRHVR